VILGVVLTLYGVKSHLHISYGAFSFPEVILELPTISAFVSDKDMVVELFPFKGLCFHQMST
jgi:hypothetical protein